MNDDQRFIDNGDGAVTDRKSGLMWTRTDTMNDMEKWVNYMECLDYVRGLNEKKFAGYDDWRLPTRDELSTLYDECCSQKDKFGKTIRISECFAPGGGFSMVAQLVSGRPRTWVFNLRDGQYSQPDGLWTISESARAVRAVNKSV
ncbi:MAG: DUF1566 domain-containing protein [Nitrospinae bacterium]|nr:DUF1566 domain-containing protein [Nitrospinota bacterium]